MSFLAEIAAPIVGALIGSDASNNAADTQAQSAANATAENARQFNVTQKNLQPNIETGHSALARLSDLLGLSGSTGSAGYGSLTQPFTGASVATDPGYQFGLDQGQKALQNNAAARGGLYSGATLKALNQYGNDYATTKFNDAFNRNQTTQDALFNRLSGVAGTGQTASNQLGGYGANMAALNGQNLIGAGNAQAANALAQGNILGGAVNQIGSYISRNKWPGGSSFGPQLDPFFSGTGGSGD